VCHRDLKPDNVIVNDDFTSLKLIDFNVAISYQESEGKIQGGTGYKHWSAPETRKELHYDEKCDVWSLGMILAFMLSNGKMPKEDLTF
jgi:serine/threonine protein kinase